MESVQLEEYLSNGVQNIVTGIIKASFKNPKTSLFMIQHGIDSKMARKKRQTAEQNGEHIPPFLIASVTNLCNLHCKGCYARASKGCVDHGSQEGILTGENWDVVFSQAEELGIEFILLAGGEPFVRKDVLEAAGVHKSILFPIFTNGTLIDDAYLELLEQNRNLLPILSIEGNKDTTDERRGTGIYEKLQNVMKELGDRGILFGASVTVTKQNMEEVLSDEFVQSLEDFGSKAVVYVEYVPMDDTTRMAALSEVERDKMMKRLDEIRKERDGMVFLAFPGDEKSSGGCLAAGRGFFHINACGGAEPCPFSPYSDTNILKTSLKEALHSPLFQKLKENGNLEKEHIGGCTLFEQEDQVRELLAGAEG